MTCIIDMEYGVSGFSDRGGSVVIEQDAEFWKLTPHEQLEVLHNARGFGKATYYHNLLDEVITSYKTEPEKAKRYLKNIVGDFYLSGDGSRRGYATEEEILKLYIPYAVDALRDFIISAFDGFHEEPRPRDRRTIKSNLRETVLARDGRKCRYCGASVVKGDPLDHIIPYSLGGKTDADNLVSCCRACNSRKAGRTPEQAGMKLLPIGE